MKVCPLILALGLALAFADSGSAAEPLLTITADRPEALYETGEEVVFSIRSTAPADAEISWALSLDGYRNLSSGKAAADGGEPITAKGSLPEPGFLLLTATVAGADGKPFTAHAAAGISPTEIAPSLPVPEDFDAFWAAQKAKLGEVPMTEKLEPVPLNAPADAKIEAFDLSVPAEAEGPPVSGYFAKPKDAAPKSLPAVLWVHGAGVRSSSLPAALGGARDGFLSLDINAHGLPNGKPEDFYKAAAAGELRTYRTDGNGSRETVYFRGMFVRLQRALDFLTSRPEWNGKTLAVIGHSQGGYQALVAGGLDPRVTFIGSGVPAGCDHSGMVAGRISGWPKLVPLVEGTPDPAALEASRYVDAVNFATRYRGEAILSVGFIDRTCPPTSIYAASNVLPGSKTILNYPSMGHASTDEIRTAFREALLQHAELHASLKVPF